MFKYRAAGTAERLMTVPEGCQLSRWCIGETMHLCRGTVVQQCAFAIVLRLDHGKAQCRARGSGTALIEGRHDASHRTRQQRRSSDAGAQEEDSARMCLQGMKLRRHFEKSSEKRARERTAAVSRARKAGRKRPERDALRRGRGNKTHLC